jgi:predicted lipoprotein with Yx(FWY)xxD motif
MTRGPAKLVLLGTAGLAAGLILTACGSSGGSPAGGGPGSPAAKQHSAATTVQVHSGPMGHYLTDQNGKTLYMFASDSATKSSCTGACQTYWPLVKGPASAGSGISAGKLSTITTAGTKQATYAGHPLYYYAADKKAGDTTGQGSTNFGARWWMLAPSGNPITTSTGTSGGSSSSSSAGGGGGGWS